MSYGDDCSSLSAFLPRLGTATKAIGIIDPKATTDEELKAMHKSGVRGIRVNLYRYGALEDVSLQKTALLDHAARISTLSLPWSLTMTTTRTGFWSQLAPFIESEVAEHGVQMVTDHFALLKAPSMLQEEYRDKPTKQPGFEPIMGLVRSGRLVVKLSAPYHVSEMKPAYADLKFLVRAFVDANKHGVVWGSDWPHTPRMKVRTHEEAMTETPYLEVDDGAWLRSLRSWLSDEEWDLLMVQNPKRVFAS
jgi:predicted TIM-barrel fold metal-dependent hydrolase